MKFYAFYLPQFHTIPENDKWWGRGFTEWTNVKKAKSLYRGHVQPIRPLNDNYYNLLDKTTVEWQTELLHTYQITGLIYYHYYFNGKMLLEKPAENLLRWTDVDQPFFFCWANHTWNRSWNGSKEVLIEQTYGSEKDWEEHFQYLLPFFEDNRYEKIDDKPVFMIFNSNFDEKKDIVKYFDRRCKECGFKGIYWINTSFATNGNTVDELRAQKTVESETIFIREPNNAELLNGIAEKKHVYYNLRGRFKRKLRALFEKNEVSQYDGNVLYRQMKEYMISGNDIIHGVFFSWDNSPRHGHKGYVITSVDKRHFFEYMDTIKTEPFCFVNAWNEWCEGMILEPTEQNGYKYLEWIKEWQDTNG